MYEMRRGEVEEDEERPEECFKNTSQQHEEISWVKKRNNAPFMKLSSSARDAERETAPQLNDDHN